MAHQNNGFCAQCLNVINRYQGFNENLKSWFFELQKRQPEMHTSCAGRGEQDQESCFMKGASRAHYGQSAHNFNVAMDLFVITPGSADIYPSSWFKNVLAPNLPSWIEWYGTPGAQFYELPHVELRGWRQLKDNNSIKLVE